MKYHGTDTDSAHDIADNGLNKQKWMEYVQEGGDPTGFSLTENLSVARQHAEKSAALRGKEGAIIGADDGQLPPLKTGGPTESFDLGEFKIAPENINSRSVGPGVFKIIEDHIPPLQPSPP